MLTRLLEQACRYIICFRVKTIESTVSQSHLCYIKTLSLICWILILWYFIMPTEHQPDCNLQGAQRGSSSWHSKKEEDIEGRAEGEAGNSPHFLRQDTVLL